MLSSNTQRKPVESSDILGVELKLLKTFPDDRGFFREVIRSSDPFFGDGFAQWSHSCMHKDTVKAWHFHHTQIDWWYCGLGLLDVALYDAREESPTYGNLQNFKLAGNEIGNNSADDSEAISAVIKIPQGVLHGCRVLSAQAHLLYITSEHYNPEDEGRIPFNSDDVPFNWGNPEEIIVAENDRKLFIPPHPRDAKAIA